MDPDYRYDVAFASKKYLYISAAALTLYDYLLTFNDEIRYVWKGRKSSIFYLYILYRTLLVGHQFWHVYFVARNPLNDFEGISIADYYIQPIIVALLLFFSDIIFTLRIYALTNKSKILTTYIVILAVTKLVTPFVFPGVLRFATIPVGTLLEISAFAITVWFTCRNVKMLRFSAVARTVVAQATMYFLVIVLVQISIQVSVPLMEAGIAYTLSFPVFGLVIPVLTLRFAISLKKSADPEGVQEWQLKHFTTIDFAHGPPPDSEDSTSSESIEMASVDTSHGWTRIHERQSLMTESGPGEV